MTDDRLYEFPESIPGQLAMSTDVDRFRVDDGCLGYVVFDTFLRVIVPAEGKFGVNDHCYVQRGDADDHAARLNGFAAWAGSVVDA